MNKCCTRNPGGSEEKAAANGRRHVDGVRTIHCLGRTLKRGDLGV